MIRHGFVLLLSAIFVTTSAKAVPKLESDSNGRLLNFGVGFGLGSGGYGVPQMVQSVPDYTMGGYVPAETPSSPEVAVTDNIPPETETSAASTASPQEKYICFPVSMFAMMFPFSGVGTVASGSNQADMVLSLSSTSFPDFVKSASDVPCDKPAAVDTEIQYAVDPGTTYTSETYISSPISYVSEPQVSQMYQVGTQQVKRPGFFQSMLG